MRACKYREVIFRHWKIDARGNLHCTLDPTFFAPVRTTGRKKKYLQVQLMLHGRLRWYYIHRLMAFSWLPKPKSRRLRIVDHRNGNSLDNAIENLRWVTSQGNNLNRPCYGLVREDGLFYPKVAGHIHYKFGTDDEGTAIMFRKTLVECYVNYTIRNPDSRSYPHEYIGNYK